MKPLLSDIEAFLKAHGMAPTRFGDLALGDRHFVRQIREGRRVWPETEAKVRRFMATYRPDATPPFPASESAAALGEAA
jgi:hypothetical protein